MEGHMGSTPDQRGQAEEMAACRLSRRLFLRVAGALGTFGGSFLATATPAAAQAMHSKENLKTVAEVAGAEIPEAQLEKLMAPLEGYFKGVSEMRQVDAGEVEPVTVFLMREE